MIKVKDGYAKLVGTTASGSASHILLSNGGVKAVSDFALKSDIPDVSKYLPLSGGKLLGELQVDARVELMNGQALEWTDTQANGSTSCLLLPRKDNSYRPQYYDGTNWHYLAYSSDLKNPTNYYWANIAISSSKSTTTTPTFGSVTVPLSGLIVGSKSTDTSPTRVLMCYDTTLVTKYINIGNDPSAGNAGEFHYTYSASASASNNVGMGFYSGNRLKLYYNGGSGVGKVVIASAASGGTEYELLHLGNYKNYVDDMYWANVKVSSTSNATTKPTFSNTIVNGVLTVNGGAKTLTINHNHTLSTAWNDFITCLNPNLTATYHTAHITFGRTYDSKNVGYIGFKYAGSASNSNMVTIGLHSVDNILNILASGNVGIGTISPSYKLHVEGDIYATSTNAAISINRTGTYSSEPCIGYYNAGTRLGSIGVKDYNTPFFWNASTSTVYTIWHSGNDGSGSGLDADLLDGKHASAFALASHGVHWEGFTKRANSNASWGTLIASNGYTPLFWLDSTTSGGVAFSDKGGQTFMQIDGYFYQNEGKNRVTDITETVTALGTSGNYLTWTKNGTTNNITIPYASSAGALGTYSIQHFMTYDNSNNNYLAASFTNENFSKKAAEKYIEYWDSAGGWFNSRWGLVLAISGFHRVGSSDSYVLLGGGGHKLESNLSVNYAASTGNADTVDSCHKDDFLRRTATLGSINKFVLEDIPKGVTQVGSIGWTDYQNHPHAGGLWMTLRGTSSLRTALILFPSYSMSSPPILYSSIDGGAWQGGYQLAYTSQIPTTMAWGSITGKPSTFTPSSHTHDDRYYTESEADSRFINHSGDTMTGPLTFANGTWNVVGDDAAIGDYNAAGMLGLKSINNNIPGIGFHNSSNTLLGRLQASGSTLLWNDLTLWHAGNDGAGSGLDADTVDGVHASSLSQIKYIGNTSDFCYDVILLCKRDVAHSARLDGLLFTTGGGVCRYHCADAHFWHSCWSVGSYDTQKSISNKGYDGYGFEFCTCTYGGAVWYAIKLNRIQAVSYFFMGDWDNINWTLITYYHTSQGVKNSEIYNSISNLTSTPLRYSGSIYAHHFYESSDRLLKTNIVDINSSDNIPQLKSFDWKSDGSHSYGLIALELEEMGYPELVSNNGSYKTVNYSAALSLIVGKLLVKIQEIEKENKELRDEINNLKTNKLWQS